MRVLVFFIFLFLYSCANEKDPCGIIFLESELDLKCLNKDGVYLNFVSILVSERLTDGGYNTYLKFSISNCSKDDFTLSAPITVSDSIEIHSSPEKWKYLMEKTLIDDSLFVHADSIKYFQTSLSEKSFTKNFEETETYSLYKALTQNEYRFGEIIYTPNKNLEIIYCSDVTNRFSRDKSQSDLWQAFGLGQVANR